MVFSGYMAFVYCPWDVLIKAAAVDEEVWFGIRFHGDYVRTIPGHGIVKGRIPAG